MQESGIALTSWVILLTITFFVFMVGAAIVCLWLLYRLRSKGARGQCVPPEKLKQLVAGQVKLEDQSAINRHLENCQHCQQVLEALVEPGDSWPETAKRIKEPGVNLGEAARKVMDSLKNKPEEAPIGAGQQPATSNLAGAGGLPVGLLTPAQRPNLLGMLGPYEIQAVIGQGGMGIVLKGFDTVLQRVVAIKVLASHLATNPTARKRFLREAQAVAAVTHEHVVTIHAVDEANGFPYLVMQFVNGQSLQERIDTQGPLELKEILRIGMQTASGLAAAHAQGLIHRDIKPANILLENGVQRVRITDFGLARAIDDASLTQSGFIAGSPQFMAPEQARGESVDHRADLFSLGSVLYTMTTGHPPFRADSSLAILRRVSEETPRSIREINPELPEWLSAIIEKLHAKNPADRFQTAGEVADALGRHLAQLQQVDWVPLPSPAPARHPAEPLPITSLTICPLCNCRLHVPESKVGQIVDCPECHKPFQVVDASSEIRVLHPARPERHQPKQRSLMPVFAVLGVVACLFFCCVSPVLLLSFFTLAFHEEMGSTPAIEEKIGSVTSLPKTVPGVGQAQILGEWQVVAMERNKTPVDLKKIKSPKYVFRQDGTYERQEDRGSYSYHPLARPDCLLKLYPKDAFDGECLTLKCQWEAGALRLTLDGPPIRDDEFESVTLKRVN